MMAKDNEKAADKIAGGAKKAGKAMKDMAEKAAANASSLNGKVIDHAEENTRAAFAAMRSAASVKSVQELAKVQTDYVRDQGARSMTQVREIGDLIAQFGRDAMAAVRPAKDSKSDG
ncbi:MAG: phasin family protein [Sphingomonadaceae bacterium]